MKFKDKYLVIFIFLLALGMRLAFTLQSSYTPFSDAYVYDNLGLSISQGKGYADPGGTPHSFYPPFYPFFLSIIYFIFGHNYLAVKIAQSLIGALTCVLVYLMGKKIRNNASGTIAAFISAFYPPFIKSAGLLLTELVFTFLLCLIVYYMFKIQEDANFRNCIILGCLSGFALLTKSIMVFFPLFIIPIFVYSWKKSISSWLKKYIVVLLFFILSIMPWILRNYIVYNQFGIISTQGGITFYSSYRPPEGVFGKLATSEDPVIIEANKISSPVLYSNFLVNKTIEFIMRNPGRVLLLELKKVIYLWAPFDWEIVGSRWFNFIYVALLPFFAIGLIFSCMEFKRYFPMLAIIIYFQIATLVFYGSPRFRLAIDPYIFILSAIGILEIMKRAGLYMRKRLI